MSIEPPRITPPHVQAPTVPHMTVQAPSAPSGGGGGMNPIVLLAAGLGIGLLLAAAAWYAYATRDFLLIGLVLGGLLLIVGLLLLVRWLFKRRRAKREARMQSDLAQMGHDRPADARPEEVATNDDLARRFGEGLAKFKAAGKSVYDLPWYLIVGEPGAGKTEAMRHSNIGFPPGLQDPMQGAGGTYSMSWWFTNKAVLIDTAGRLMFGDRDKSGALGDGYRGVWKNFLETLKRARPTCPINGLILVVPATSLLVDPPDEIEAKAQLIRENLDLIQKTLAVRFSVYVVVSKCDKITGFKGFFDGADAAEQNQILGWSNPADLDEAFRTERYDQQLDALYDKLRRRRTVVLAQAAARRETDRPLDAVDELYDFPDAFLAAADRLRPYLDGAFTAAEWTQPPFVRGVYFTSSMREGDALDTLVSAISGVPPEQLPEGRQWAVDKSYFLRDVFTEKAFQEKGLVVGGAVQKPSGVRRRQRLLVGLAAAASLLAAGGLFAVAARGLGREVLPHSTYWSDLSARFTDGDADALTFAQPAEDLPRRSIFDQDAYVGDSEAGGESLEELHRAAPDRLANALTVPGLFKIPAGVFGDGLGDADGAAARAREAYRAVFRGSVARPLAARVLDTDAADVADAARYRDALARTLEYEYHADRAAGLLREGEPADDDLDKLRGLSLAPLFAHALNGRTDGVDVPVYDNALRAAHGLDGTPSPDELDALRVTLIEVRPGLDNSDWARQTQGPLLGTTGASPLSEALYGDLSDASLRFEERRRSLASLADRDAPDTRGEYGDQAEPIRSETAALERAAADLEAAEAAAAAAIAPGTDTLSLYDAIATRRDRLAARATAARAALAGLDGASEQTAAYAVSRQLAESADDIEQQADAATADLRTRLSKNLANEAGVDADGDGVVQWRAIRAAAAALGDGAQPIEAVDQAAAEALEREPAADLLASWPATPEAVERSDDDQIKELWANVVSRGRRNALVNAAIDRLPASPSAMEGRVAEQADALDDAALSPEPLPGVAALPADAARPFAPSIVARYTSDFAAAGRAVQPDVPPLLERGNLANARDAVARETLVPYLATFANFWRNRLDSAVTPEGGEWGTSALRQLDPADVPPAVASLATMAEGAAGAWRAAELPASVLPDDSSVNAAELVAAAESLAAWRQASGGESGTPVPPALSRWLELDPAPEAAVEVVRSVRADDFPQLYLAGDATSTDWRERYLGRATASLAAMLDREVGPRPLPVADADLQAIRFPLLPAAAGAAGDPMQPNAMRDAVTQTIDALLDANAEVEGDAAALASTHGEQGATAFRGLFGLDVERYALAKETYRWLYGEGAGERELVYTLEMPGLDEQARRAEAIGAEAAASGFTYVTAGREQSFRRGDGRPPYVLLDAEPAAFGKIELAATDLVDQRDAGGQAGERAVEMPGLDAAGFDLIQLLDAEDVTVSGDGLTAQVTLYVRAGSQQRNKPLFLDLRFSRPMPAALRARFAR